MQITGYGINEGEGAVTRIRQIQANLDTLYAGENQSYEGTRAEFHLSVAVDEMDVNQDMLRQAEQKTIAAIEALVGATTKNNDIAEQAIQMGRTIASNIRA
nr:hypothetical protein [Actinomycetales bacterium]